MSTLVIDNYDSFTYNLVQYIGELGGTPVVHRNDEIDLDAIVALAPERILISPGPCTPSQAGISKAVVERFGGEVPILGVCLGHQAIGEVFGATVARAERIMHGKLSMVHHQAVGVFAGLPTPYEATRYHSLSIVQGTVPDCLEVTAWTERSDGSVEEIMGVRHRELAIEGVQFHPESIKTEHGHALLDNFLKTEQTA
ncbi:MAG: aminodeoxychorismate/anthranilate synthase component II [Pseudomonadota bacterium]